MIVCVDEVFSSDVEGATVNGIGGVGIGHERRDKGRAFVSYGFL